MTDGFADAESKQGGMVVAYIGVSCVQASPTAMLDDDVVLAASGIERSGLLASRDKTARVRWVVMDVLNEMCHPHPAAGFVRYFDDDVPGLCGLRKHLVNVGVLKGH